MLKLIRRLLIILAFVFLWTAAYAEIPRLINYQGRLTDKQSKPLEGSYELTFRIYDDEASGTLLWEEKHPTVLIQKGIFSILLGSIKGLDIPFDKQCFLEIKVGEEVMAPRQRIASSAYAIRAEVAEEAERIKASPSDSAAGYLSDKVDGKTIQVASDKLQIGNLVSFAKAEASNQVVTTSNTFEDLPDMALKFAPSDARNPVLILFSFEGPKGVGDDGAICRLLIDGDQKSGTCGSASDHGSASGGSLHYMTTLSQASHTVKVQYRRGHGDGNGPVTNRVLTVIEFKMFG